MSNDYNKAEALVSHCERTNTNLCSTFEDWTRIALAVSNLGEAGRPLFHRLARMDASYRENENNKKYDNALRTSRSIDLATLFFMAQQAGVDLSRLERSSGTRHEYRRPHPLPRIEVPPSLIPQELVDRSQSNRHGLYSYLAAIAPAVILSSTMQNYKIGATRMGETIFPQIDSDGRCRSGKVIMYNASTGHREKGSGHDVSWLHTRYMKQAGLQSYNLRQCLFGEHLLPQYPDAPVCLVESEKSALICSTKFPDFVWLATGGKQNFKKELLQPLATRRVVVYADADGTADWREKLQCIPFAATWTLSDWAKNEPAGSKRDIADLLLSEMEGKDPSTFVQHRTKRHQHPPAPEEIFARMERKNPALTLLWTKGNFELVAV